MKKTAKTENEDKSNGHIDTTGLNAGDLKRLRQYLDKIKSDASKKQCSECHKLQELLKLKDGYLATSQDARADLTRQLLVMKQALNRVSGNLAVIAAWINECQYAKIDEKLAQPEVAG